MADVSASVPITKLMAGVTMELRITGMKAWTLRRWLAIRLIGLAASLLGCAITVDVTTAVSRDL